MTPVFIGLGSNLGNGPENLRVAWAGLGRLPGVRLLRLSSPYHTAPVGMDSPHWFTNAVGLLETSLPPPGLLAALLGIEAAAGRQRSGGARGKYQDRPLDLDILFYGDLVQAGPDLVLPHPEIAGRLFVLAPLVELAPEFVHPVLGLSAAQLLTRLTSLSGGERVRKISWPDAPPAGRE